MDIQRRHAAYLISSTLVASCLCIAAKPASAQTEATDLQRPVAMAVHEGSGHAFIVEAGSGRLLRWDGEKTEVIVQDLRSEPAKLDEIQSVTFHNGNKVTVVGTLTEDRSKRIRFATFEVVLEQPTRFVETYSGDMPLGEGEEFAAFTSTDLALYLATNSESASHLYRLEPTRAQNEQLKSLFTDLSATITALTIDRDGHIVAAVNEPDALSQLRFHHGLSGKQLLLVPTDAKGISSLSFSTERLLYGSCSKDGQRGVYRFDAFLEGGRQKARAVQVEAVDKALSILCTEHPEGIVLVGGEQDGKVLRRRLD